MDPYCQLRKWQAELSKASGIFRPLLQTLVAKVWMALRIPLGFTIAGFPSHSQAHTNRASARKSVIKLVESVNPKVFVDKLTSQHVLFHPFLQETQKKPLGLRL